MVLKYLKILITNKHSLRFNTIYNKEILVILIRAVRIVWWENTERTLEKACGLIDCNIHTQPNTGRYSRTGHPVYRMLMDQTPGDKRLAQTYWDSTPVVPGRARLREQTARDGEGRVSIVCHRAAPPHR